MRTPRERLTGTSHVEANGEIIGHIDYDLIQYQDIIEGAPNSTWIEGRIYGNKKLVEDLILQRVNRTLILEDGRKFEITVKNPRGELKGKLIE